MHETVRIALEKSGWEITHDPFIVSSGGTSFRMDLGAERLIIAEKGTERIAVEIKSLAKVSLIYDFYEAFGQYMFYRDALDDEAIERTMYIAFSLAAWKRIEGIPFLVKRFKQYKIKAIIINLSDETISKWIK